jgi:N-acetylglucosaminyl-diphospho-decaprenol L-rhamnosyltransferase
MTPQVEADNGSSQLPRLRIVIVNWNTGDRLRQCLETIAATQQFHFVLERVVVVDNASSDHSQRLPTGLALPLELIQNESNTGFAFACNQGANGADANYILFLNPDTLLDRNSLDSPIQFLETHPDVGICGIQLRDDTGEVARSCARFPTTRHFVSRSLGLHRLSNKVFPVSNMSEWDHLTSRYVDEVIGAFFLIRTDLFTQLNGFDTRFYVYYEELDLSLRAFNAGWRSYYLSTAVAFHEGGASSAQVKAHRMFYNSRSCILYARKHMSSINASTVTIAVGVLEPLIRTVETLFRRDLASTRNVAMATFWLWRFLLQRPESFGRQVNPGQ